MQSFLKKLEEAIKIHLKEAYLPPHRAKSPGWIYHDLMFFSKGCELLSTAFTEDRAELPKNYFNKKEYRSAYLLYFVLINAAKVWKCLEQLTSLPRKGPLKILDLGCGPGTASLTASFFFKDRPLEVFGLEQNSHVQKDALGLWKKIATTDQRLQIKTVDLHSKNVIHFLKEQKFNLVIAANFLSELRFDERVALSRAILENTQNFIIIEPALQKTTRDLMMLRDKILENGWGHVLSPCLHQKNCPMLADNKRDWCHFYFDWKCPHVIRQVDEIIRNKHDYLKMAYMIFQCASRAVPCTTHDARRATNYWRVVSSPLISNGKRELNLCGDCGRLNKITRLNKDQTFTNGPFEQIHRGDIIQWPDKSRVERADKIEILKKFY